MPDSFGLEAILAGPNGGALIAGMAVLGVGFGAWSFVSRLRSTDDAEVQIANDRLLDKRRAWVQGASFILMRLHDNAYLSEDIIRPMLANSWGIESPEELDATVSRLVAEEKDAWGLLRALLLVRSAVAVGWVSNDASFQRCYAIGQELQQVYDSWEALGRDALARRRAWRGLATDGSQDDEDMKELVTVVDYLRDTTWSQTPWTRPLDRA